MFLLGVLFLTASALAQPTVFISRSSIAYPRYRVYLDAAPEVAIVKEAEGSKVIPVAPILVPLFNEKSVELEIEEPKEEIEEPKEEIEEPKEEIEEPKEEIEEPKEEIEEPKEEIEEQKDEELEHKTEEELKEELLIEEGPKQVESESDNKVIVQIEEPKPPKFITSLISALPIKLPHFELPFNLGSWWNTKEKAIRLVPAYAFV